MLYQEIKACRNCGSDRLDEMLSLGNLAISGFPWPGEADVYAPLTLLQCADCSLVQLQHTVDRDHLYKDYYYRSGTNESMVLALRDVVDDAITRIPFPASKDTAVVDIGANDGTLLNMYPGSWQRLGFEPSQILQHPIGGIVVAHSFFPNGTYWYEYLTQRPHIITSIAMFYDLDDPNAFAATIKDWLHPDGIWVVQMPSLPQMLYGNAFDNICHEHLCYWPLHALLQLADRHGLELAHMSENSVNGASTRYIFRHATKLRKPAKAKWLWHHHLTVLRYNMEHLRNQTLDKLRELLEAGEMILGYGASTKGNTLLQYYGITANMIPMILDRNPDKWGHETAGTRIPIFGEAMIHDVNPDYLFVLPWHFIDSFQQREAKWLQRGGRFIVPLPELSIVGARTNQGGDPCPSTAAVL